MKVKDLLHALGDIDDKYLVEEYSKDDITGVFKRNEVIFMSRKVACIVLIIIVAVTAVGLGIFSKSKNSANDVAKVVQIPSPLTEVSSVDEMKKYLGFDVPVLDKEVQNYIVIGEEKYATHARIIYSDGTSFEMEKGDSDVSGIYGGTLEKEENINGVTVTFYNFEDTHYANWTNNGFSYSYSCSDGEVNEEEITKLME